MEIVSATPWPVPARKTVRRGFNMRRVLVLWFLRAGSGPECRGQSDQPAHQRPSEKGVEQGDKPPAPSISTKRDSRRNEVGTEEKHEEAQSPYELLLFI
jgi:hypothetical protein